MTPTPRIVYRATDDATPELEVASLATVYRFIIESARKRGRLPDKSGPDDEKEGSRNDLVKGSIP